HRQLPLRRRAGRTEVHGVRHEPRVERRRAGLAVQRPRWARCHDDHLELLQVVSPLSPRTMNIMSLCSLAPWCGALGLMSALSAGGGGGRAARVVVQTSLGVVQGVDDGAVSGTSRWLGVPYAQPPVGALRFKPPQPVQAWNNAKTAQAFGGACIQAGRF